MMSSSGDIASSVVRKIAEQTRRQAIADAITALRGETCACASRSPSGTATLESLRIASRGAAAAATTVADTLASPRRGIPSSLLTHIRETETLTSFANDPTRRFVQYQGPIIPPTCPRTPVEQLNATLPKPSTRCLAQIPFYQRPSG